MDGAGWEQGKACIWQTPAPLSGPQAGVTASEKPSLTWQDGSGPWSVCAVPSASPCPGPSAVSPEPWRGDPLGPGSLSNVRSLHTHLPASFCAHVCTCTRPLPGQHPQALGLRVHWGFRDRAPLLGIRNLSWGQVCSQSSQPLEYSLSRRSEPYSWQQSNTCGGPWSQAQILPSQDRSSCLQLTSVLLTAVEEALLAEENQTSFHPYRSSAGPESQGPSA